jgi:hypothetical protein
MERAVIDMIIDEGAQECGRLDMNVMQSERVVCNYSYCLFVELYHRGLIYFDVPIKDTDIVIGWFGV